MRVSAYSELLQRCRVLPHHRQWHSFMRRWLRDAAPMPSILFTCPTTQRKASTGVLMNAQTLQKRWQETLEIRCPHCCEIHEISVRQTYIEMTLDDAEDRTLRFVASLPKCGLL